MPNTTETVLAERLSAIDLEAMTREFNDANQLIVIPNFIPSIIVDELCSTLPRLESSVHRNFIPKYKKGGSISRYDLDRHAPVFGDLYRSPALRAYFNNLAKQTLIDCPLDDPHTYALYYYTEPGDHIGYHYDTSYYKGARYTVLIGLVDDSSCKLECQLYKDDPNRDTEQRAIQLAPGTMVFFNGDNLYHRITPLGENEQRIALTLEYLTTTQMNPWLRFISNMKDSIAYFGFKQVFSRRQS